MVNTIQTHLLAYYSSGTNAFTRSIAGIGLGIAVAIFDFVLTSANVSSVVRVSRRSLALWSPQQRTIIENVYNAQSPKIITLECRGLLLHP